MRITAKQKQVLKKFKVPLSAVFDATGLKRSEYRLLMKPLSKLVAIGVSPCAAGRHRMRTRSGNCVECNPTSLTFLVRHHQDSFLYIATSAERRLLKIGISANPVVRIKIINRLGYANVRDWVVRHQVHCKNAGAIENQIQRQLSGYAEAYEWEREGVSVMSYETFSCSYTVAKRIFDRLVPDFAT